METKEITIAHKKIKERIELYTHYTGEARRDAGLPARLAANLQASGDDDTQLCDHIENAAIEARNIIANYFTHCTATVTDDAESSGCAHHFAMKLPALYPAEAVQALVSTIENYIFRRALQEWLMQHRPDESVLQGNEVKAATQQLHRLLTQRSKPTAAAPVSNKNINI